MSQVEEANALEVLVGKSSVEVELSNKTVVLVKELTIRELPAFTKSLKKLIPAGNISLDSIDQQYITSLVLEHAEDVIEMVSICSNIKRASLDTLGIDDLIKLVGAIVEVNVDFFITKILPVIAATTDRIEQKMKKPAGQELSQD